METKKTQDELLLQVSSSPHIRTEDSTTRIMLDVIIALIPALIAAVVFFGTRALAVVAVSVIACVVTEAIVQKLMKRPIQISNLSAVVTGILLAFNVPATMPFWQIVVAAIFSIAIVKEVFGGLGSNFVNPALAGRAFLLASWPAQMSSFTQPYTGDALTSATYLSGGPAPELTDAFMGAVPGVLGEVSALALLIGAAYLLIRGVIKLRIPVVMILTFAVSYLILNAINLGVVVEETIPFGEAFSQSLTNLPIHVLSGGLILGAFFMATDYSTSPMTAKGQIIFAIGAGFITALIRVFGTYAEGVSYAILIMNVCTPLIDKYIKNEPFGGVPA